MKCVFLPEKTGTVAAHNTLGTAGEDAAAAYLAREGYVIRDRNWRMNRFELDIVAAKDGELVVVEVKTRAGNASMEPQEAVGLKKIRRIVAAADAYVRLYALDMPVRFDVIAVTGRQGAFTVNHFAGAFYPPLWPAP